MAKIRLKGGISLTDNQELKAPKFNFSNYDGSGRTVYHNNAEYIDFVTDNGSLYVCLVDSVTPSGNIGSNSAFLKLVDRGPEGPKGKPGEDGTSAIEPRIGANFINDQLKVTVNDKTVAVSPSLTGPTWKPVRDGNILTWELTDDRISPEDINLMDLRPVDKCPLLLRTNSDNTKRSDEVSGPANFIQWKYEGDEYWTNLISISELMNLALCGICFWYDNNDGEWHFGNKEVLKATYQSDKNGRKIVSRVELGDILFDAGSIPINDYGVDIELINQRLEALENATPDLDGYATQDWVNAQGFLKNVPEVDAYTKSQADAKFQPKGNYVTSVNGVSPQPGSNGAITIEVGNLGSFDVRLKSDGKTLEKTTNGTTWTSIVDLSQFGGSGQGCDKCWSQEEIVQLIENVLQGRIPTNYVTPSDLDEYMRRTDVAATYATMSWVSDEIARALSGGQYEPEYHRVFTLYKRTDDRLAPPNAPLANVWEWNMTEGDILADSSFKSGWDNHPQNATTALPYLWMASATFSSVTHKEVKPSNATSAWTLVCLTGETGVAGANGFNGTDGADGNGVEFIFTLVRDVNDKAAVNTPVAPSSSQADSYPAGWEDHPQGIGYYVPNQITTTLENLGNNEILFGVELASMRTYANGQWGPYCAPFIWSMWGEDGIDGDGVEYIFIIADEASVEINNKKVSLPEVLWKVEGSSPNFIPTTDEQVRHLGSSYQVPDWIGTRNNGWTDNPSDVDSDQPFEFVAIRKYHDGTGWGPFCEPKLWSHFGGITVNPVTTINTSSETNYVPYKEWAFYRANDVDGTTHTDLSTYDVVYDFSSFGTQENPNPVYSDLNPQQKLAFYRNPELYTKTVKNGVTLNIVWTDTVPAGDGQLWVITAHIGDETQSTDQGWTTPSRWGDKSGFNVEYSASNEASAVYANPSLWNNHNLTFNDFEGSDEERETSWRSAVQNAGYGVWNDVVENPKYMATSVMGNNGVWSKWTITKIVGEDGAQGRQGEPGQDGNGVEFVFFALTPEQYNNRSNFIGSDNKFYVYDNLEHEQKTWNQNEYLPYAIISGVPEGRLWATDDNPGVTEERPYIFVSARHQVNGRWNQFHNIPGTGLMTSFGPASLWLAGDEIDYTYAEVNFAEDTVPVLVDSSNHPVSNSAYNSANRVDFYHGNQRLVYKSVEVKVNGEWVPFITVSPNSGGTSNYIITSTPVAIAQNLTLTNAYSYTTDTTLQSLGIRLAFGDGYTFNAPIEIPLRLTSFESYLNSSGNQTFYCAEETLKFVPVRTEITLCLSAEGIIKKSEENSSDFTIVGLSNIIGIFRTNTNKSPLENIGYVGVSSFPTAYSNWAVKVFFDDVQQYNIAIGNIYNYWRNNSWNDSEDENADDCGVYYDPNGSVRANNSASPIYVDIHKTFTADQHSSNHYVNDVIFINIDASKLPASLKDAIRFDLYDGSALVDSETIPVFYSGKNGSELEVNGETVTSIEINDDNNTAVFYDGEQEVITEITAEPGNSLADVIAPEQLSWWDEAVECVSDDSAISSSVVSGVSKQGAFITNSLNGSLLNTDLNVDGLMTEIIRRLGGLPVVQDIKIIKTATGSDITGNYIHQNEEITISAKENFTIAGVLDSNDQPITLTLSDGRYVGTGVVSEDVDYISFTGTSGVFSIPVFAEESEEEETPSEETAGISLTHNLVNGASGTHVFDAHYDGIENVDSCNLVLHFSKKATVIELNDVVASEEETPSEETDMVTSEINADGDRINAIVSFANVASGTIIKVWATGSVIVDGSTTQYASRPVYFKI